MTEIICKRCKSGKHVKNGLVRGLQRYRCKVCKCNFTNTKMRRKHPSMKALSILLYSMGNMSYRMIGKLLDTSHVSVYNGSEERLKSFLIHPSLMTSVLREKPSSLTTGKVSTGSSLKTNSSQEKT